MSKWFDHGRPYLHCDPAFRGLAAIALIAAAIGLMKRATLPLLAFAAAATIEIRFMYPYPNVWPQYYLMWSIVAACLYGTTIAQLLQLASERLRAAATIALAICCAVLVHFAVPVSRTVTGLPVQAHIMKKLRPGETVWMFSTDHPIAVRDASYYWFASLDLVPFSLKYVAAHPGATPLPVIAERDLPVCRAELGLQPDLRFVSGWGMLQMLPEQRRCLRRMIAAGHAVRTFGDVWDLHPEPKR